MKMSASSPLSDFLHPGEALLVSCCNLGATGSRYSIAVVTADEVLWLNLDEVLAATADTGVTGLCVSGDHCFMCIQGSNERVVKLGRDLRPLTTWPCSRARDLHSLAEHRGRLHLASSGTNEIVTIDGQSPEAVVWAHSETDKDYLHLNSLCFLENGRLLFTMFGPKVEQGHRVGAVVDAGSGVKLVDNLSDPHSLSLLEGGLAFCESDRGTFNLFDPEMRAIRTAQLDGYVRGCAWTGRHYVVGSSRWRGASRSMGSMRQPPALAADRHSNNWQRSGLYFLGPDLSVAFRYDFTLLAPEIYDVVYLGSRFNPTRTFDDAVGRRMDAIYDEIEGSRVKALPPAAPAKPAASRMPGKLPQGTLPPGTPLPPGTILPPGTPLPPGTDLSTARPPPIAPASRTFHFVEDYERLVARLVREHPLDEAMAIAVGGAYDVMGRIEAKLLRDLGLADGMRIVDLGCGSGRLAAALHASAKVSYVGTDIVQQLLDYAKTKAPEYTFLLHRELSIPQPDASADIVSAFSLFTHLQHAETFVYLEDAVRVLKPGGLIVFSFLEFAERTHWGIFKNTSKAAKQGTSVHLNQFIERSAIKRWARRLRLDFVQFIDGTTPIMEGNAFGQAVAVLKKPLGSGL